MNVIAAICKWVFLCISGALALLGMLLCFQIGCALFTRASTDNPCTYVGREACAESIACRYLPPLPEQGEGTDLPMVLDYSGMCDYSGCVLFRAPAAWQEAFCTLYPAEPERALSNAASSARDYAAMTEDKRLHDFIAGREWQGFHSGSLQAGRDWYFCAMRDASGEYVLIFLYNH